MEEIYTCECGCQKWIIGQEHIKCANDDCKKKYTTWGDLDRPEDFNIDRKNRIIP
jgi:hypothetical protein